MKFESNLDYRELKVDIIERITLTNIRHKVDGFIQKLPIQLDLRLEKYIYHIKLVLKSGELAHKLAELDDIYVDNIRYYRARIEVPPRAVDDEYLIYIDYYSYDIYN